MPKRPHLPLTMAQERMIRRLGLTPGHVEACPEFRDGHERDHWKRTVRALYKKGVLHAQKDCALDEVFIQLTREGLRCARDLFFRTKLTDAEAGAFDELRKWRTALKLKPPAPPAPVESSPPAHCSQGKWLCPACHSAATKDGLARARRSGVRIGRPPVTIPEGELLALRASGTSLREIAKILGLGAGTVHRYLKRVEEHH